MDSGMGAGGLSSKTQLYQAEVLEILEECHLLQNRVIDAKSVKPSRRARGS